MGFLTQKSLQVVAKKFKQERPVRVRQDRRFRRVQAQDVFYGKVLNLLLMFRSHRFLPLFAPLVMTCLGACSSSLAAPQTQSASLVVGAPLSPKHEPTHSQLAVHLGERSVILLVGSAWLSAATESLLAKRKEADLEQVTIGFVSPLKPSLRERAGLTTFWALDASRSGARDFGFTPNQTGLVAIDYAGFVRKTETFEKEPTSKQLSTAFDHAFAALPRRESGPLEVKEGQAAPDFIVSDMNGTRRRLSDLKGRKHLLLTFFPKCFTFYCGQQLASLRETYSQLQAADVEVWGVSVDTADGERGQRAYAKHLALPFPLVPDEGRNLSLLYGATQSPTQSATRMSVFIDKSGIVRRVDKQINPQTHGEDVLAQLKSYIAASPEAQNATFTGTVSN